MVEEEEYVEISAGVITGVSSGPYPMERTVRQGACRGTYGRRNVCWTH